MRALAGRLSEVPGVVGVMLGGSRARGEHTPDSDVDLGLYYRPPLDVPALGRLARDVSGPDVRVTAPGEWGPWVDGGGWLSIDGRPVDWIYRNLDRVHAAWVDAQAGRFAFHGQVGHPLGVPDFAYPGEVALGVVLADPTGELRLLQERTRRYPPQLREAVIRRTLWEATFSIRIARKASGRGDTTYVAGCLFRAATLCAHALFAAAGRWLISEKGAVTAAGRLPVAPHDFGQLAHALLAGLGTTRATLDAALIAAEDLIAATEVACRDLG
jgi:hypothetical protein